MVNSMSRMPPRPVLTSRVADAGLAGLLLDAPLHGLDLVDLGETKIFTIDKRFNGLQELLAQRQIAGHGPDLDERLPLPGAAHRVVIGEGAGQRPRQRAAMPLGTQAQIDAEGMAAVGVRRQQAHHFADDAGEEFVVADAGDALAARRALFGVNEHQVDVAGVIQFLAAVLAERQNDARDGLAVAAVRLAEAFADLPQGSGQGDLNGDVGDARDVAGDLLQRPIADDVVGADAQHLPLAKAAEDAQHGRVLVGGIDLGLQAGPATRPGWDCAAAARAACRDSRD